MKFNKTEVDNMNKLEKYGKELDKCGDKHCGNITSRRLKKEGLQFLNHVTKTCRWDTTPKNEKDYKIYRQKYDKCFTKHKKRSTYHKNLTQRKTCEDKNCSSYQKKIQKILSSKNIFSGLRR